jgi:pimeloyl-ACP methyl ester carboxylesterase
MADKFGQRLTLALKALSMSRGRLAVELGVDKSLIGRWASGAVRPSAHNLERLTRFLAQKCPGLTLLDWDRTPADFARLFGVDIASVTSAAPAQTSLALPAQLLDTARNATDLRGSTYEGFWKATHPAVIAPGRFFHEHGMIRLGDGGLLEFELGGPDVRYVGSLLPIEGQVFAIGTDTVRHLPCFMIFDIVTMPKLIVMDGLLLTAGNAMRNPSAYPIVLERIGDLSGNRDADDAYAASLMTRPQFVENMDEIPEAMRSHLLRDFGPAAAAIGGPLLLTATQTPDLSRIVAMVNASNPEPGTTVDQIPSLPPLPHQHVQFCSASDGTNLAYSLVGKGPPLVKAANWLNHLEYDWSSPVWRHWLHALSRERTLIRYDERGNGLSDWNTPEISFDAFVDDLSNVGDAAGLDQFDLLGISQGCSVSIAYAVRHPERVRKLVLYGGYAAGWRIRATPGEIERREAMQTLTREGWGQNNPVFRQMFTRLFFPGASQEEMTRFNELQRLSTSPENAERLQLAFGDIDVRDLLAEVRVPTLILHAREDALVPFEAGRALAAAIPGAQFVALESRNHLLLEREPAWSRLLDQVNTFLG